MDAMKGRTGRWATVAVAVLLLAAGSGWANNLQLSNVSIAARDNETAFVRFDLAWENAWRYDHVNHDAVWLFFKVQREGETAWNHAMLEADKVLNPTGFQVGSGTGLDFIVPEDKVGVFVRFAGDEQAGNVAATNVQVVWNFASNGLPKTAQVRVQAFGVEMAYVAEGPFWAGNTNGVIHNSFRAAGDPNSPAYIGSTNAFTLYWGTGPSSASVPSTYPNGFAAFYCMKYQITQQQYVDFLNSLTRLQQELRFVSTTVSNFIHSATGRTTPANRNGVRLVADPGGDAPRVFGNDLNTANPPDSSDDGQWIACNWINMADGAAFADWAGLRPMTELEFEKACRGPMPPVQNEYAWGDASAVSASGLQNSGTASESYTTGNLLASGSSPARVGIFAKAGSTRAQAGASYWGIMELSGHLFERPVGATSGAGRAFTGRHGNGTLAANGAADVPNWTGLTSDSIGGIVVRGGSVYHFWVSQWGGLMGIVASRNYAEDGGARVRDQGTGWRGVRTAPTITP